MNKLLDRCVDRINSKRLERYGAAGFKPVTDAEREEFLWLLDEGLAEAYERTPAGPDRDAHMLFGDLLRLGSESVDGLAAVLSKTPRFIATMLFDSPPAVAAETMRLLVASANELIKQLAEDKDGQVARIKAASEERRARVAADCAAMRDTLKFGG